VRTQRSLYQLVNTCERLAEADTWERPLRRPTVRARRNRLAPRKLPRPQAGSSGDCSCPAVGSSSHFQLQGKSFHRPSKQECEICDGTFRRSSSRAIKVSHAKVDTAAPLGSTHSCSTEVGHSMRTMLFVPFLKPDHVTRCFPPCAQQHSLLGSMREPPAAENFARCCPLRIDVL